MRIKWKLAFTRSYLHLQIVSFILKAALIYKLGSVFNLLQINFEGTSVLNYTYEIYLLNCTYIIIKCFIVIFIHFKYFRKKKSLFFDKNELYILFLLFYVTDANPSDCHRFPARI